MTSAAPKAIAIAKVLDQVMRSDKGRLLSILATSLRDLSLAEEVLQEAAVSALTHWGRVGLPKSPQGWLLQVARRKAIDRLRGAKRDVQKSAALAMLAQDEAGPEPDEIPDERLRLIFTCCHPALERKSAIALTLRTVCGLSTQEIARLFLDQETTMGQRLSRAKSKIAAAGIPFKVPEPEAWPARLDGVLTVIYLIFTTGYLADPSEKRDLCAEAEFLLRLIDDLHPNDPECEGALALVLLTGARRAARIGADGASVPPHQQDRALWDQRKIERGREILWRAVTRRRAGPFQLKAAIADCHFADNGPDWPQIAALYQSLWQFEPTPIVALNHAVALSESGRVEQALGKIEALRSDLKDFQPFYAALADVLAKNGDKNRALEAYQTAVDLAVSPSDVVFLEKKRAGVLSSDV